MTSEVEEFLKGQRVEFEPISHPAVFSSVDEAKEAGVGVDEIGKTLVIKTGRGDDFALVVIPGDKRVSNRKIQIFFHNKGARLATEDELERRFPHFELGAVPPFGQLLDLEVYIDRTLVGHEMVLFNAGTHRQSIKMSLHDFVNTAEAAVVDVVEESLAA